VNKSAEQALVLARQLGGESFVTFVRNIQSQAMADHIFPRIAAMNVPVGHARLCDKAFVIGVYEAWKRLSPLLTHPVRDES